MYKSLTLYFAVACSSLIVSSTLAQSISADPLTGKPSVSLPIWSINSGDIAAGVSLSYYGTPKVNDSEGSVGMGWNLNAGGGIYRQVKGLPDDIIGAASSQRNGWLHGNISRTINSYTPSSSLNYLFCSFGEDTDWNTLNGFEFTDTEPDLFSISAPGLSGQFIFDNSKLIQTIPYQDLKIEVSRRGVDSLIQMIVITNNAGIKYTFVGGDFTTRSAYGSNPSLFLRDFTLYQYPASIQYFSSWQLQSINSPNGGFLSFGYGDSFSTSTPDYKCVVNSVTNKIDSIYYDNYAATKQLLQTITGSNEVATFNWTGTQLSSISITDRTYQSLTKTFNLQYHEVTGGGQKKVYPKIKRSYLSGLTETLNCSAFPGYSFDYYGINFSKDTTGLRYHSRTAQDLFGYYDSTAVSGVPDIYVSNPDTVRNGDRYRLAPAPGYTLLNPASGGRTVNPYRVFYGSLKSVTFPSGGKTTITYEAADYYDARTQSTIPGGGPRVKSIKTGSDASAVTTTYKYRNTAGQSSGQWLYRPMYVAFKDGGIPALIPYNIAPDESLLYSRIEVSTSGRGKTVYEYQNQGMYPVPSANGDFNATLTHLARQHPASQTDCPSLGSMESGYYTFPYAPNTNYNFERALPTRITDYTRSGKVVQRKSYTYQRTTLPVVPISGLVFEQIGDIFQFGKYKLLSNVSKLTATESLKAYDQVDTTKFIETVSNYTYSGYQMLSGATTTNSDNTTLTKTYKYAADYTTTGTNSDPNSQFTMIQTLKNTNRQSTLVETVSSNGSTVTGASLTLFSTVSGNSTVRPSQQLALGDPTGFTPSIMNGTIFTYSPNYYPVAFVDAYDGLGHPLIIRDQSRAVKSFIYGYNQTAVTLDIANARYDQVVYSDFEPNGNTAFFNTQIQSWITSSDSWSGQYSLAMTSATAPNRPSVLRAPGKNYRFSCWAKASTATTLSLFINNSPTPLATVSYPSNVTGWQYLEATVDMSSVTTTTFSFTLTSNGNINLDNVAFYPESSSIVAHTYDPLNGKLSDHDSRGVSAFQDYDALGRVRYVKNTDKDVVQIKDYHYMSSNGVLPVSSFTGKSTPNIGTPITYTANPTCTGGVTYAWYVDGTLQPVTTASLTYTFTEYRNYHITLVASASFGSTSTDMEVVPVPVLVPVINASGPTAPMYCDQDPNWTLSIDLSGGCSSGCLDNSSITYQWFSGDAANTLLGTGPTIAVTAPTSVYCTVFANSLANKSTGIVAHLGGIQTATSTFTCKPRSGGQ